MERGALRGSGKGCTDAQERAQDAGTLAAAQLPRPLLRGSGALPAEVQAEDSGDPVMLRGL